MTHLQARILIILLAIVVLILAIWALRATYYVSMPLTFAFFIAVLVWPLHEGLRRRLPGRLWWLSTLSTMLVILLAMAAFASAATFAIYRTIGSGRLELYAQQWRVQRQTIIEWLRQRSLPVPGETDGGQIAGRLAGWAEYAAQSITGWVAIIAMTIFFILLMLIEASHWKHKSRAALEHDHATDLLNAFGAITHQVRTFLVIQALVSFTTASITGIWLWVMGVPFVLLWALLTFLADFVPNVGPTIAVVFTSMVALITLGLGPALVTAAGLFVIQQFFGNFVDPMLKGHRMSISPLVVLLAVVFWTWVWGPAGAVLAVPITATIIIACAHVPELQPLALMLSRTADQRRLMEQTRAQPDGPGQPGQD
jgi:AI-2 transport protein TqsA